MKPALMPTPPSKIIGRLPPSSGGAAPDAFHHLMVKGSSGFVPLGPSQAVRDGLSSGSQNIDTTSLQANLEHYKSLEAQAQTAQTLCLTSKVILSGSFRNNRTATSHRYVAACKDQETREQLRTHQEDLEQGAAQAGARRSGE